MTTHRTTAGRPKSKNNKVPCSFRFRKEYALLIAKIAEREHIPQVRVLEAALDRYGKDIRV